ncbi:DUF6807 domain-containing protein [Microbacterium halophytorum]|uniref:DUF6807 domain-containing protein n=1 Tax=Microbacterium halophytorum TaxID=2067568 RepID=UPI000CFC1394|nr:PmoA family protein [Microbacterium halophytorum]
MTGLRMTHEIGREIAVRDGEVELFRYVYAPDDPQLESPRPYVHPLRTRAGNDVSLYRPHDHVWHKGLSWSLPVVNDQNFWGGPTYIRGEGYVQLPNNGTQAHRAFTELTQDDDGVAIEHELDWTTQAGGAYMAEVRRIEAHLSDAGSWVMTFATTLENVSGGPIALGSPTTKGRENAGYGGLFWRGLRSFTDGTLVTAAGTGSGGDVRGQRHEWMAFEGRQDATDATSLVLMLDDAANPHHPPQWFARSEEYAALNPAPFFSEEVVIRAGESAAFRYGVGIADADAGGAQDLLGSVRRVLAGAGS